MREPLCAPCAERRTRVPGLAGLAAALAGSSGIGERNGAEICPYCGTSAEAARRTGLAGCPLCYVALAEVWPALGAVPGRYAEGRDNG